MRVPAVSGSFYPADAGILRDQIRRCFIGGPGEPGECTGRRSISAVVAPHAGYVYSGICAAHSFKAIAEDGLPDAYVVIGPDHHGVPYDLVTSSEDYCTPLGPVKVHQQILARLREYIPDDSRAHVREHSIEVELPFLQYIDKAPAIVPVIMGRRDMQTAERLARALKMACEGYDVVIIASSDLVHYMPKAMADRLDSHFLNAVASGNVASVYDEVRRNNLSVCGYGPIATAMLLLLGLSPVAALTLTLVLGAINPMSGGVSIVKAGLYNRKMVLAAMTAGSVASILGVVLAISMNQLLLNILLLIVMLIAVVSILKN